MNWILVNLWIVKMAFHFVSSVISFNFGTVCIFRFEKVKVTSSSINFKFGRELREDAKRQAAEHYVLLFGPWEFCFLFLLFGPVAMISYKDGTMLFDCGVD